MKKTVVLSKKTLSTAVFEYLERRGYQPNHKSGVRVGRKRREYVALVDLKEEKSANVSA